MAPVNQGFRPTRSMRRRFSQRGLTAMAALSALTVASPSFAQSNDKESELPRLGLDAAEPQVPSARPATAFGVDPATSKEYVLDFHGYMLLPMRLGVNKRQKSGTETSDDRPGPGQSENVLHTPPLIPQNKHRFEYTAVVPDPWIQLNFTYGNSLVSGTAILAATTASEGEAYYDPVRQLGVSDAFVTLNLSESVGTPLQLRVGAMTHRYGAMGAFDAGRYATPLIGRVNAIGETVTAGFAFGDTTLILEQGIGGQLGRAPSGQPPAGWNDFADPNTGASFVSHLHAGLGLSGLLQFGAHYITAFSQDDQNLETTLPDGRITILGGDARLTAGRYGHLYLGGSYTKAVNANVVSGIVEVLNARGGAELTAEYLGENSGGDGALTTFGAQYDMSLSKMLYEEDYQGKNPDVLLSVFGIGTKVKSDDPDNDGDLKLKTGAELTYNLASWIGTGGRLDHVRLDHEFNRRSFNIYTARLLFHTDWLSRDEFALQYSHFAYGREVNVSRGYPPKEDPSLYPDRHVLSLSATFWW